MTGFKIIAIKTGSKPKRIYEIQSTGAKLDFFKNLEENKIYAFTSDYSFPNDNFDEVVIASKSVLELYSFISRNKKISVNINAIVGNNGSGKSSLVELLFWANYNIGCVAKLLRNGKTNNLLDPYKFIDLEILYSIDDENLIRIEFKDGRVFKNKLFLKENTYISKKDDLQVRTTEDLRDYFYSIVINYSHYALNSNEIGDWIIPLFHKNDGYQTPIVLNPMRTGGIIDINDENKLLKRRLLGNLLEEIEDQNIEESLRNIGNNKIVTSIKVKYSSKDYLYETKSFKIKNQVIKAIEDNFRFKIKQEHLDGNFFTNICINYIIEKLLKMSSKYRPYYKYKDGDSLKYIDSYIKRIKYGNSHIVFKVKGAILYLKYYELIFGNKYSLSKQDLIIDIEDLSKKITKIREKESDYFINTFTMVPPSFFETEIILSDGSLFSSLSSGEKQRIHSNSSIIYHIINLNSVKDEDDKDKYDSYPYINIILDEIELYYHPDWQRNYVKDLLGSIRKIPHNSIKNIKGINITFLTHSPFILSDISNANVLKLKNGSPQPFNNKEETFGANINDILANEFFLRNGFMGEFVKTKINSLIDYINENKNINNEWSEENAKEFIELIGEPLIRIELREMFFNKYYNNEQIEIDEIDMEIERLKKIKIKKIGK
ncbi:Predicted ATP-binding protein involved in virulence [Chryseobacterium nakagawai]|uniref:Rad50/SbcC-type AAA domain-containing protein n=1 Tax=Chryseobacterium nakagawai TaxID=1241982 RepID=A0AAD1DT55_CHRNA|nr:AAA family ATPase [Chryseobacterium nakagawai]AZA93618.1 hypothetical protein EG343_24930 [Chryseobacterium nakagawai]VEH20320.1 Predicted ATP-binding protein involved in virulence [Chryseobacterium nakagawai]